MAQANLPGLALSPQGTLEDGTCVSGLPDHSVLPVELSLGLREQAVVSQSRGTQPTVVPGRCGSWHCPGPWPQSRRWVWSTIRGEGEVRESHRVSRAWTCAACVPCLLPYPALISTAAPGISQTRDTVMAEGTVTGAQPNPSICHLLCELGKSPNLPGPPLSLSVK